MNNDLLNFINNRYFNNLNSVENFNIEKYMGKWYEIATSVFVRDTFEKNCKCTSAEYTLLDDNSVEVKNTCIDKFTGKSNVIIGNAIQPNPNVPGELQVSFGPAMISNTPNYYVIAIDKDYKYALVGEPTRLFLWILSRKKEVPKCIYNKFLNIAKSEGYDLSFIKFEKTKQNC